MPVMTEVSSADATPTTPTDTHATNTDTSTTVTSTTTTRMSEIRYNPLQLPKFSGNVPTPKNESSFRVWKYTLDSIKSEEGLGENQIKGLVRRSLTGEAAEALLAVPINASSEDIIRELTDSYGTTTARVDGWSVFHSATQQSTESITEWKMRLQRLYDEADPDGKLAQQRDSMLATAFWTSLNNKDLRLATAPDRKSSFAALFRAVKENESLYTPKSAKPTKSTVQPTDELEKLRKEMDQLKIANEQLRKQVQQRSNPRRPRACYHCNDPGHIKPNCPAWKALNSSRRGTKDNLSSEQQ